MTRKNRLSRISFSLFLTLLLFIFVSGAWAEGIKLGALMPMTGDLQAYGESCYTGVKLAQKEINAAGGVLGGPLHIRVGDTQTKPQPGIDAAQKLVSIDGVSGIIGALSSGVTIPVAQSVSSPSGVPQVSPASTSPVITGLADNDFLFRSVPSDAFQGVALAAVVSEQGYNNVATLYVNNDYGEGLADSFKAAFEKKGARVSQALPYEPGNASYRGELSKAASGGAKALLLIGYPENGVTILRQALEEGYFREFIYTDGLKAPEIIDAIGAKYLNGSFGTAPQAMTDTPAAQRYLEAYKQEYGEVPPKPFIDTSYDATYMLALAAEKAGSSSPRAIRDALRAVCNPPGEKILPGEWYKARKLLADGKDIDYVGASGSVDLDMTGDVSGTFAHWMIKNGKIVTVKVFEP
jgi:ABC-type branched-subunit amino acid transport system substrate-binding protein